ncbi:MAG: polyhydroxyalkanoic acid system family protein [Burkholderiales bacterium]
MADISIQRPHHLGLGEARRAAQRWAERAQREFELECSYTEGVTHDEVGFKRGGVEGTLSVRANRFELEASLGLIAGMFKDKIEAELARELDAVLAATAASAEGADGAGGTAGGAQDAAAAPDRSA